jgi:ATP/maltotriose-dependent transcriptional regulator MalT
LTIDPAVQVRTRQGRSARPEVIRNHATQIPQTPRAFIPRPRLAKALDDATSRPLTVVIAPAGSGKTSTLAHWAGTVPGPVRWWNPTATGGGDPLAQLSGALRASGEVATLTETPELVIVDDAHLLPSDAWPLLEEWLRTEPPDRLRLVLASRRDLPLALITLELTDSVSVLRADALRFRDGEARALVALHAPDVTDEDADAVQERAQGWAAALVLGARTLAGSRDRQQARDALTRTEQPVLDYLLGEVFTTLPAATRHVLLCTSDTEHITDASAVILSGDTDAPSRLADLAADGLFVSSYRSDETTGSFRTWLYHPLMLEALRRQVALDGPDHALNIAAHRRAAAYYAAHGPVHEAIQHATRASAYDLLVSLLIDEGPALVIAGHEGLVLSALQALPAETTEQTPALLGVAAIASRGLGDIETAARLATQAIRAAEAVRQQTGHQSEVEPSPAQVALLADAAMLETWQARYGWADAASAIRHAREVVGCRCEEQAAQGALVSVVHEGYRQPGVVSASRLSWLLNELSAAELWMGQLAIAEAHNGEALLAAEGLGQHRTVAGAYANRAVIEVFSGRTQTAAASVNACLVAAERADRTEDSLLSRAHVADAWIALSELNYDRAVDALARVDAMSARLPDALTGILAETLRASLLADAGDLDAARRGMASPPPLPDSMPAFLVHLQRWFSARWALLAGDLQEARRHADAMLADGWVDGHELIMAISADLAGDPTQAARRLDAVIQQATDTVTAIPAAVAAMYKLRMTLRDEPALAGNLLLDVLSRLGPQRLLGASVFTGPDPALNSLLRREASRATPAPFADELLAALDRYDVYRQGAPAPGPPTHENGPARSLPAQRTRPTGPAGATTAFPYPLSLTPREADVLHELALGGSYVDIAHSLYVTENTVKTHIASLYRKLGVERRAEALRRARELGLL